MDVTLSSHERSAAVADLASWDWHAELRRQDRRIPWLAAQTRRSLSAVYGYRHGRMPVPIEWLEDVARILDVEVVPNA